VDGDELTAVKWAIHAWVQKYRDGGAMGESEYTLELFQDALALWERVRGVENSFTSAGQEMGLIGGYLDYAVEDPAIREGVPEAVVDACDALRRGEDVPDISECPNPEDAADASTDGGDGPELMTDGGEDIPERPNGTRPDGGEHPGEDSLVEATPSELLHGRSPEDVDVWVSDSEPAVELTQLEGGPIRPDTARDIAADLLKAASRAGEAASARWEVEYTNPQGAREVATFQGSWVVEWFIREFPGEIHSVDTVPASDDSGDGEDGDSEDPKPVTDGGEDVMDALTGLDPGDDVRLTATREGDELDISAHVTDAYHEPPERDSWGWVPGGLEIYMDATDETIERLDIATHSLTIRVRERKPGEWSSVSFTVWDPEVDDGAVVRDDWTDIGELISVKRVETDGGKPVSDHGDVNSTNAYRDYDGQELFHLLELIREGDEVNVNRRRRTLTVTRVSDSATRRTVTMKGNGTTYSLILKREGGEPADATLQYPSGSEELEHLHVANRNPLHISEYDQLLPEELETIAAGEYVDTSS